ncbi:MAG: alpha/beta hydrolase [Pseudomonadota bacterium]|nr:alpha/beta hydrolase [Pseudomonadota bacterium]
MPPASRPWRAVIVHGYGATPADHWFAWLGQRLQAAGVSAHIPALPDSLQPDFAHWQQALADAVGMPDARTLLVAHSLGCISLLHYLSAERPQQVGGVVLVSGFGARLPQLPAINGFDVDAYVDQARLDVPALRAMTGQMHHVISANDGIVAPAASRALAVQLGGQVHEVPRGGHFLASDGFTQLPAAWSAAQTVIRGGQL